MKKLIYLIAFLTSFGASAQWIDASNTTVVGLTEKNTDSIMSIDGDGKMGYVLKSQLKEWIGEDVIDSINNNKQDLQSVLEEGNTAVNTGLFLSNRNEPGVLFAAHQSSAPGLDTLPKGGQFAIERLEDGYLQIYMVNRSETDLSSNVYFGINPLIGLTKSAVTAGSNWNTAFGSSPLYYMESGYSNTALGSTAGTALLSGNKNIFIGWGAGHYTNNDYRFIANESTIIGTFAINSNDININREIRISNGRDSGNITNTLGFWVKENGETEIPRQSTTTYASGGMRSVVTKEVLNAALSDISIDWNEIGGDQSDINISGFTNDSGFTTNTGTVESVSLSAPTGFDISGSPVTTTGTLTFDYSSGYQAYTTTEANKLSGIEAGAEVNVNADWDCETGDCEILNKPEETAFSVYNQYSEVTVSTTSQTSMVTADTGSQSIAVMTEGASYIGSVFGMYNHNADNQNINIRLGIGNRANIINETINTSAYTGDIPVKIDYTINFFDDNWARVTMFIQVADITTVVVGENTTAINIGNELDLDVVLTAGTLTTYSSYFHKHVQ